MSVGSLRDVTTVEELIAFLQAKGRNHQAYYHYTTWDSLEKIMGNSSFLLTRGNSTSINDQHEALMKGSRREWNRTYIGSFSFGTAENMAMWALYGLPWEDAVRLEIPRAAMNEWVGSIGGVYLWGTDDELPCEAEVQLADIVYAHGRAQDDKLQLTHRDKTIWALPDTGLAEVDSRRAMTGYIKNYAWHYENEVRLIIRLPHDEGVEKVKVPVPQKVLDQVRVITGPSFQHKGSALYRRLQQEGRLWESDFRHLVKYRPLCSLCSHEAFSRRKDV
ncbi:MAG: hypothetical protein IKK75_02895 [Clostridia bacterium]|nr:hypothetical protein [Clostridia bacterium]